MNQIMFGNGRVSSYLEQKFNDMKEDIKSKSNVDASRAESVIEGICSRYGVEPIALNLNAATFGKRIVRTRNPDLTTTMILSDYVNLEVVVFAIPFEGNQLLFNYRSTRCPSGYRYEIVGNNLNVDLYLNQPSLSKEENTNRANIEKIQFLEEFQEIVNEVNQKVET